MISIDKLEEAQLAAEQEWQQWPVFIPHYTTSLGDCGGYLAAIEMTKLADDSVIIADLKLDPHFQWGDATEDSLVYDLQAAITHNIGHIMGARDMPDDYQGAMRNRLDPGDTVQRTVTQTDIELLQEPGLNFISCQVGKSSDNISVLVFVLAFLLGFVRRYYGKTV